jgi:hypothetical protein
MEDPVHIAVFLIWVAIIGAWVTHQAWARQAVGREVAESCVRCGHRTGALGYAEIGGGHMCEACRAVTRRNYRAGFLFFASLGALFIAIAPLLMAVDYRRFGTVKAAKTLVFVAAVGVLSVGMGFAIRHYGIKRVS